MLTCPACLQPIPSQTSVANEPRRARLVLAAALAEWDRDVREPPFPGGAARIDTYIRSPQGLTWRSVELGPGARPNIPYTRNRQFEWCGAFAAFCYGAAGLKRSVRAKRLASTYRLWVWASEANGARRVDPEALEPGDIVVMGPAGDRDGAHIAICVSVGLDTIATIEGNAHGLAPGGIAAEGVVRCVRPLASTTPTEYRVLFGVRPLASDFEDGEA